VELPDFDAERPRLTAIAVRILGSEADADDVLQEAWLRLSRTATIDDLPAWLTTVVTRLCLDHLRRRRTRLVVESMVPDDHAPIDPEGDTLLAEVTGDAMQVVLDALAPAERVALLCRQGRQVGECRDDRCRGRLPRLLRARRPAPALLELAPSGMGAGVSERRAGGLPVQDAPHANATAMVAMAIDVKTVQTRVGHRRATTTLDIYAQPTAAADRGAAETLGVHFLGSPRVDEPSEGSSAPPSRRIARDERAMAAFRGPDRAPRRGRRNGPSPGRRC